MQMARKPFMAAPCGKAGFRVKIAPLEKAAFRRPQTLSTTNHS
jgi:hypothetical protein